ncbi:sigma 54-interacting transcriptional regulator [Acanthopleuribacter pedis]|uniref:Sigma-54-dependent Fis family transcriptional regulator n=1 Tax=Acanthopleuribacter pedis TaxID=442870 RepID=A0A8J7U388_9BACT|nr:sigma 54-interacting transcriptional regulator [Acanthopleuribacter pedis]MBO1317218.1 sigma-54-dependent Fis family transcriptional regulator [Acanthopleuribacter pedis]MBO1318524.1 sigma-54-dependent Fis family transcriptional regulator [Acanthopleuribacter pedis]
MEPETNNTNAPKNNQDQAMPDFHSQTRPPDELHAQTAQLRVLSFTIACHPDPTRIGERAVLHQLNEGKAEAVSRNQPDFHSPVTGVSRALDCATISRRPVLLEHMDDGVLISTGMGNSKIRIDGRPVTTESLISFDKIEQGVVLEINRSVVLVLQPSLGERSDGADFGLKGHSPAICHIRDDIQRVADLEMPLLIRGESGTGKELVARAIHERGSRMKNPLVSLNLAALPATIAAAELFGVRRGAYTGASESRQGFFRAADRGILFLDEIGEAPLEVQAMLLRVLETGDIFPVGFTQPVRVDVRVLAATDADLEAQCEQGRFKAPLLHRLSSYEIWLPPLRRRRQDIPELFIHFATEALTELDEHLADKSAHSEHPWLTAQLATQLIMFHWPGNVRQLRNIARQLVFGSRKQNRLKLPPRFEQLFQNDAQQPTMEPPPLESKPQVSVAKPATPKMHRKPASITYEELHQALHACDWKPADAARHLGISRSSVYALMQRYPNIKIAESLTQEQIQTALEASDGDIDAAARYLQVSSAGMRRRIVKLDIDPQVYASETNGT